MPFMSASLEGRTVVVTGAGGGIGRAIAERFGTVGSNVVVNDVDGAAADATAAAIASAGGSAVAHQTDVSNSADVEGLFAAAVDRFDTLDVLVNNAGLVSPMNHFLAPDADEAWFERIIGVNLKGTFLCCRRAAPVMARQGRGAIINMSSGGASRAHRAFSAYDASKGGIEAFTRALALDLGPYGVRVNALMPGSIDTHGMARETKDFQGSNLPLGRVGEPADMAGPALFLASDDASYVTGHVLQVDGGMLAQQRSATVDIMPPGDFPDVSSL